jgi:hypothetical protein
MMGTVEFASVKIPVGVRRFAGEVSHLSVVYRGAPGFKQHCCMWISLVGAYWQSS